MKWFRRIVLVLVLLLIVGIVTAIFFLGNVVKTSVETVGPLVTGVDVKLASAKVFPLRGKATLKGLIVGNPEGFKTDSAFELGSVEIDLNMRSLLTDTIIIERIYIGGPEFTYEQRLTGSNVGALMKQIEGEEDEEAEEEEPVKTAGGKKLVIRDVLIEDAQVKLNIQGMMGTALPIPLPPIHIEGIGEKSGGVTAAAATAEIVGAIVKGIGGALASSGKLAVDGVKLVGDGAMKSAELVGEGVGKIGDGAVGSVKAVGGAAGKTADAIGDGASKVVGGVKGLFGGGDEKDE